MLRTRNVYIDTEVFISNNYFDSKNLQSLSDFGKDQTVNIFLTEITRNEIRSNIKEEILTTQNEINIFKKNMSSKGKILKNFAKFEAYFDLPKLELKLDFKELSEKLDIFIRDGNVSFIPFELADIKVVVENYFNQKPPFGNGKKKHEFPDAIVLSAIENWCIKQKQKIYFISSDPDFKKYTSENIFVIPKLGILLDMINRQLDIDRKIVWISAVFENNESNIIESINEKFIETVYDTVGYQIEVSDINVIETTLFEPALVEENSLNDEYVFQLDFDIKFTAQITYDDHTLSFYDKEDDRYYNVEKAKRKITMHITETAEVSIEAFYDDGDEPDDADASVMCTYTSSPDEEDLLNEVENDYSFYD